MEGEVDRVGYVYAMSTNLLAREGIYKIGSTVDLEERRLRLSADTSSPEPFHIYWFVRCPSVRDAQKLEKWVHAKLTGMGARYARNREFFRVGTPVGLAGCFTAGAKALGITIRANMRLDPYVVINESHSGYSLDLNDLKQLDEIYKKYYCRGAQDLAAMLMSAFIGTEFSAVCANLYSVLSDTVYGRPPTSDFSRLVAESLSICGLEEQAETLRMSVRQDLKMKRKDEGEDDTPDWTDFIETEALRG